MTIEERVSKLEDDVRYFELAWRALEEDPVAGPVLVRAVEKIEAEYEEKERKQAKLHALIYNAKADLAELGEDPYGK